MDTMEKLTLYVSEKAKAYLSDIGEKVDSFPVSIVDFVIEEAINACHFPSHFTEKNILSDLDKVKNALAMACVDVYSKAGAEGQISHSENGISRAYSKSWITPELVSKFPNYVEVF